MDLGFKGKLAVVSGSTAGIGFAIARTLAREGARIVINGRTEKRVSAAEDSIRMEMRGAEVQGVAADLGTAKGVEEFVKRVPAADILVNNLGIFALMPFIAFTNEEWLWIYDMTMM